MKITRIKSRSILFAFDTGEWELHLHAILGTYANYLIDTGLGSRCVEKVLPCLTAGKPLVVINTHHHWDHVWGNGAIDGGIFVAHRLCGEHIVQTWDVSLQKYGRYRQGEAILRLPDVTFDSELCFVRDRIRLLHTPGHTDDSISVLDEAEGVLNAADNIGDTMEELVPSLTCDMAVYRSTLARYESLPFDTLVSGHNKPLDKSAIQAIKKLTKQES